MISQHLKSLRKNAKLSQQRLSNKTGITRSSIAGYEIGKCVPPTDVFIKLIKGCGGTVEIKMRGKE